MTGRQRFYEVVSAAVADFVEHGFDGQERLERWLGELRQAAVQALIPESQVDAFVRTSLARTFRKVTSTAVLNHRHPGIEPFKLEQIRYGLHSELRRRIHVSANLIRLNKSASVEKVLQRFAGWASSIPAGGTEAANRAETAQHVRRSIAGLAYDERRVIIDQGHKLTAAVNDIVARDGGAIAMVWHHVKEHRPAYDARPEHVARNGKVFVLRDNWALKDGLIKLAGRKYLDEIDQPGEKIYCRCSGVYLYTPSALPPEMWTEKGRAMILRTMSRAA